MSDLDLAAIVSTWPVGDAAVAVLNGDGVLARHDAGRVYPWASVTKIVTALAVLDACRDGMVALDDAVGPPGATLAHLLAHTSGLPWDGETPLSRVGTKRTYAARVGYELAGRHLSEATGRPIEQEITDRVLRPLGMAGTAVPDSPAVSAAGPLADLAALAAELLRPRILDPGIVAQASTVVFPGLPGVLPGFGRQPHNDWGLGCEIRDHKEPHWTSPDNSPATFGHFGQSGSFLWVDPEAGLACVSLADTPFGDWSRRAWPDLSTRVLQAFA